MNEEHRCEKMDDVLIVVASKGWELCYTLSVDGIGIDLYIPIEYCPFCGKELKEVNLNE